MTEYLLKVESHNSDHIVKEKISAMGVKVVSISENIWGEDIRTYVQHCIKLELQCDELRAVVQARDNEIRELRRVVKSYEGNNRKKKSFNDGMGALPKDCDTDRNGDVMIKLGGCGWMSTSLVLALKDLKKYPLSLWSRTPEWGLAPLAEVLND